MACVADGCKVVTDYLPLIAGLLMMVAAANDIDTGAVGGAFALANAGRKASGVAQYAIRTTEAVSDLRGNAKAPKALRAQRAAGQATLDLLSEVEATLVRLRGRKHKVCATQRFTQTLAELKAVAAALAENGGQLLPRDSDKVLLLTASLTSMVADYNSALLNLQDETDAGKRALLLEGMGDQCPAEPGARATPRPAPVRERGGGRAGPRR